MPTASRTSPPPSSTAAEFAPDLPAAPIAPEGWPIVAGFLLGAACLTILGWFLAAIPGAIVAGVITGLLCLWCIWFFRDPARRIPVAVQTSGGRCTPVISPADGVICFVGPALPPAELGLPSATTQDMVRVSVFMNVFNVHVNRSPVQATVQRVHYRPGKFFNASFDKASEHNERTSLTLQLPDGRIMVCVQIAGLIARRIVCRVKEGKALAIGERFGLIRFGSRVDVYLPKGVAPLVKVGDKSVAGETIFATLAPSAPQPAQPPSHQASHQSGYQAGHQAGHHLERA